MAYFNLVVVYENKFQYILNPNLTCVSKCLCGDTSVSCSVRIFWVHILASVYDNLSSLGAVFRALVLFLIHSYLSMRTECGEISAVISYIVYLTSYGGPLQLES